MFCHIGVSAVLSFSDLVYILVMVIRVLAAILQFQDGFSFILVVAECGEVGVALYLECEAGDPELGKVLVASFPALSSLLLHHQQIEAILNRILSSTLKFFGDFRPSLAKLDILFEENQVLLGSPGPLFKFRIHITSPMFPTLFRRTIYFSLITICEEFLTDFDPTVLAFRSE